MARVPNSAGEVLRAAVERVKADIEATTTLMWDYAISGPDESGGYWCDPPGGELACAFPGDDLEEVTVITAERHSAAATDQLVRLGLLDFAQTWPPCPLHAHSMDPELIDGAAVWRCRDDPLLRMPIGQLRRPAAGS